VRPPRQDAFQPLKAHEITPVFLDRAIRALKRWPIDIVGMDEVCRRASGPRGGRRFVALTFDGGTRDFVDFAYPLLAAHEVPFAVYLPSAFADGLGTMWWLALEQAIATHDRISLMIDHTQRHFETATSTDKYRAYYYIYTWMRTLPPHELAVATDDLCKRYSVDLATLSHHAAMHWDDVARFSGNPRATIGSSTVNYPVLANLAETEARREIAMGQAVATSSIPGVVRENGASDLRALPRLAWDGRRQSLHALRVMVSGVMLDVGAPGWKA
jgi:peptidoglycan/xylan/chitin deacetylase (PgdA/CDA1 family)